MTFPSDLCAQIPALRKMSYKLHPRSPEDLVQDTLVKALRNEHRFTPGTNLKSWLFVMMKNLMIEQARRYKWEGELPKQTRTGHTDEWADHLDMLQGYTHSNQEDHVFLQELRPQLKHPILQNMFDHLVAERDYAEIAAQEGALHRTIISRAYRLRQELKALG